MTKFTGKERDQAFYLCYWTWERWQKPIPVAAKELGITKGRARLLLRRFVEERAISKQLDHEYCEWKIHQEGEEIIPRPIYEMIKSRLLEALNLFNQAKPT